MDEIQRFATCPALATIHQDLVKVGQFHVLHDDAGYLVQRIFEIDRSGGGLHIRMGVPESSHSRSFAVDQKVDILRESL